MKYLVTLVFLSCQTIGIFSTPDVSVKTVEVPFTDPSTDTEWVIQMNFGVDNSSIGCDSSLIKNNSGEQSNRTYVEIKKRSELSQEYVANFDGKLYYFEIYKLVNFHKAMEYCKSHGMELLSIETKEENLKVMGYLLQKFTTVATYWTSGTDLGKEKDFIWLSTGEPFSYKDWGKNQPDDTKKVQNCVTITRYGTTLAWDDDQCTAQRRFICEARDCADCRS